MNLRLETFMSGPSDFEARQYLILQGLKDHQTLFHRNKLYPSLSELVDLYGVLQSLVQKKDDMQQSLPQQLKEVDVEHMQLVYEPTHAGDSDFERAVDLIVWSLPLIKKAMDEGMGIYHFVDDHLVIAGVGILPMYREEGYWIVPDGRAHQLNVLRYEVSLFTSANERYRTLKTRLLESMEQNAVLESPEEIKLRLVEKYQDLPNPATFLCETELDFPYTETILPVAKRKLMTQLFSC
jgi:hypothetical protein